MLTASSRLRHVPMAAVLAMVALGLAVVASSHWRRGVALIAGGLLLGGGLRLLLPVRLVGLLAVRARWLDVATYGGLGVAILLIALVVPAPPVS